MSGSLTVSDLFVRQNEGRMVFPRIAWLVIQAMTKYNTKAQMYFSWVLVSLAGLLLFCIYLRKSSSDNTPKRFLVFLPVLLMLNGFWQYESILWGDGVQYFVIFSVVATFALLEVSKKIDVWFGFSVVTAIVASLSAVYGPIVWPVGLLQMLLSRSKGYLCKTFLWCLAGAVTLVSFFYGYVTPPTHPPLSYVLSNPVVGTEYFLTLLGAPFGMPDMRMSQGFGLVIVLVGVIVAIQSYKGKLLRQNAVWISLVLFVFLTSLACMIGRSGFGVGQALSSRYTSVTALGIIGLYLLARSVSVNLPDRVGWRGAKHFGTHALLTLVLLGLIVSYDPGWHAGQSFGSSRRIGAYVIMTYKIQSDENIRDFVYWIPGAAQIIRSKAQFLEKNKLNVFSEPATNTTEMIPNNSDTYFALDTINAIIVSQQTTPIVINSSQQQTITITGWAVDKQANDSASAVFITVDGRTDIATLYGGPRQDVAKAYHNHRFLFSAFLATFASSTLAKGEHALSLKIVSKDKIHCYYPDQRFDILVI
jgi:hypothetical protein